MVVQHNMQAANASRMLNVTTGQQSKTTEKLASGYKINRAADDAAGLSISEKMRKQIRGLDQASTNAQDGVSAVQTAEGALTEVHSMLQRMNELAVQASNGTNSEADRSSIQDEIDQLTTEIDRVAETTKFNESYLLKGGKGTQTNTLKGHDAGIKGTFVDGDSKASLSVDLSVGKSLTIGGQNFNIVSAEKADSATASDSLGKIQDDIKNITNENAKVTINGTEYTSAGSGKDLKFDAGTGTTYSAEELSGMVKDGTSVKIEGVTMVDPDDATNTIANDSVNTKKDADGNATNVVARDYNSSSNITADKASDKIMQALKQANDIGATTKFASVEKVSDNDEHTSVALDPSVKTVANTDSYTAIATKDLMIKDANGAYTKVSAGTDITSYAKDSTNTFYALAADAGGTLKLDASDHVTSESIAVHKDATQAGVAGVITTSSTNAASDAWFSAVNGTNHEATVEANYAIYSAASVADVASFDGVTSKASATLNSDGATITFEDPTKDPSDPTQINSVEAAKDMVEGQNKLLEDIKAGKIMYNNTGVATGNSTWSHTDTNSELDVRKDGEVYYKDVQIATLTHANTTTGGAASTNAIALANPTAATATGGSLTFATITAGDSVTKNSSVAEGQNALIAALKNGEFTYDDDGKGAAGQVTIHTTNENFSIGGANNDEIYYGTGDDKVKVATFTKQNSTTASTGNDMATGITAFTLASSYAKAKFVQDDGAEATTTAADTTYKFEITKGQTEVSNSFSLNLHVGADADMTNKISIGVNSMTSEALGIKGINVSDDSGMSATYAIDAIEDAIKTVSTQRSALGAVQNRLEHTIANVDNVVENSTAAESRIRDTDMADEMVKFSKNNILAQAGQSMLAQANQSTQGVLSILG